MGETSDAHILSLLGIRHRHKVAKTLSLSPRGFYAKEQPRDIFRVWEWPKWPAAHIFAAFRQLPLKRIDVHGVATAFC